MKLYLTSLFDYAVKKHALILSCAFFLCEKMLFLFPESYTKSSFLHNFFNYVICIGLLTAISSKDKIDDEHSKFIRYSILKNTLGFFVLIFGIVALFSEQLNMSSLSFSALLYTIQGLLTLHLIFVFLANWLSPSWVLREDTAPKDYNQLMIGLMYGLCGIAAMIIIVSYIFGTEK